jgi:hypothetical protein
LRNCKEEMITHSQRSHLYAEQHSYSRMAGETVKLYKKVLAERAA